MAMHIRFILTVPRSPLTVWHMRETERGRLCYSQIGKRAPSLWFCGPSIAVRDLDPATIALAVW